LLQLAAADCRSQLLAASPDSGGAASWIDPASPPETCTKQLPGFDAAYQLVFSDEFDTLDRNFK
jgi:hypothetical protein